MGNGPTEDEAEIIQHDQLSQQFEEEPEVRETFLCQHWQFSRRSGEYLLTSLNNSVTCLYVSTATVAKKSNDYGGRSDVAKRFNTEFFW